MAKQQVEELRQEQEKLQVAQEELRRQREQLEEEREDAAQDRTRARRELERRRVAFGALPGPLSWLWGPGCPWGLGSTDCARGLLLSQGVLTAPPAAGSSSQTYRKLGLGQMELFPRDQRAGRR